MHRELEYLGSDLAGGVARGWAGEKMQFVRKLLECSGAQTQALLPPPPSPLAATHQQAEIRDRGSVGPSGPARGTGYL